MVSKQWLKQKYLYDTTLVVENSLDDNACDVVDVSQLSQIYHNLDCNEYKYTLWPRNESTKTCKHFLGLHGMPEMFYVQLNCPIGFTLQKSKQACDCDPILSSSLLLITSCNLDDGTIQRPAHSWGSLMLLPKAHSPMMCPLMVHTVCHTCLISTCPFLTHGVSLTGLVCCVDNVNMASVQYLVHHGAMKCSNVYLLNIIRLGIAGIGLVLILFIFNLSVINGTINTFIFYVNILNINIFTLFPSCKPQVACSLLSLFNLDLGITTCFYNGMDDYAKAWLQLVFPSYMLTIALLLIITSCYSIRVQRLTAQRALPVLATLFLLSYTKVLQTVCKVLFSYAKIIHLSYNTTEYVWSIDTVAPLLGLKFTLIFVICLVIFFILMPFNFVLLCTRKLSYFKLVTMFKPLLGTYFSSHKDKVYYWTGLQLLVREIVLALSGLLKDSNLLAIVILLCVLLSTQETI